MINNQLFLKIDQFEKQCFTLNAKVYKISEDKTTIDLTDIDDFAYSAIMRKLRQKADKNQVLEFMKIYKKEFDNTVKQKLTKPEKIALQKCVVKFNKKYPIKFPKNMVKNAALTELGTAEQVGQYLSNIVKFTLNRISPAKRPGSLNRLRTKLYYLNESDLSNKHMPASSAIGQSITFVKHVLMNHDPSYIRQVLNSLVKHL